jgi:alkanesulfonate monooxygenase SsuD/methylene tetrahydromethanopterin reductase-like flavin-dependent oxidoreductase (luciferase family)
MKFGIFNMAAAPVPSDHREVFGRLVEVAQHAERLGFWSLWTTEHHFQSDRSYLPFGVAAEEYDPQGEYDITADPLTLLAYVAGKTSTLRLGTAVAVLPWDHPLRTAERAAMVDVLSDGRLELGVGRGGPEWRARDAFGVPTDAPDANRKFQEAVEVIRAAWGGRPFSHDGEFFSFPPDLRLLPIPVQSEAPIWIGSASDASAEWAAERALPYATIAWPLMLMDEYRRKREVHAAAADRAGVDVSGKDNIVLLYSYCGESEAEAEDTAYEHMKTFQYINEQHYEALRGPNGAALLETVGYDSWEKWVHEQATYAVTNHMVGTADTITERLKEHERDFGLTYVLLNQGFGMMPQEKALRSMDRIAADVMPNFAPPR